jgi:ferredoxin-NADP reductase
MSLKIEDFTFPLKVAQKVEETREATSFVFEIPAELKSKFEYQPGQFVSLFLNVNGEELSRSYSLGSSPEADRDFKITVKRVDGGRGSNYLCDHIQVGDSLRVSPPSGHFFKYQGEVKHYVLFGAGSGITPLFSILKYVLKKNPQAQVTLVFANRSEEHIIYRQELQKWAEEHSSRFQIHHLLSQPGTAWELPTSRLTEGWLKAFSKTLDVKPFEIYLCGPDGYMELVKNTLSGCGVPEENIHQESFTTTTSVTNKPATDVDGKTLIGTATPEMEDTYEVEVTLSGETKTFTIDKDSSILEALIEQGENPPYSCMDGGCMACMGKVLEGVVMQEDPGILTQENIDVGECLTCQAKPRARKVKVTYDIF